MPPAPTFILLKALPAMSLCANDSPIQHNYHSSLHHMAPCHACIHESAWTTPPAAAISTRRNACYQCIFQRHNRQHPGSVCLKPLLAIISSQENNTLKDTMSTTCRLLSVYYRTAPVYCEAFGSCGVLWETAWAPQHARSARRSLAH